MMMAMSLKDDKGGLLDNGKYVRYTPEQVEALERLYHECPKPSSIRRQQLIRECPILSNIEPKQIKVWFQNRRCREKQRRESSRLQGVNRKLTAMNKLLMEENDRLQKQVSHLVYENGYFRQHTQNTALATKDTSCESVVTSHLTQNPPQDASPAGLLSIAEETLAEFLSKATGTAVEWVQMPGMKPGPDSIGIVAISHGCTGVAARACGLVGLEPTRLYAPTTLATARDFWLLRYTSATEDGSLVVCERSLTNTQNGPSMPSVQNFVRAEMLPSGYLIRPCEGGGSIIHIALRQLRQIAQEASQSSTPNWGRRPAALRALSQRLSRGFNEALNGFSDEGWSLMGNDGMDDVTILVNSSPEKLMGLNLSFTNGYTPVSNAVLCAKASMLLQNVPPALLLRFLREHRSEWADNNIDAYSAAAVKLGPCSLPGSRIAEWMRMPLACVPNLYLLPSILLLPMMHLFCLRETSSPNRTLDLASALEIGGSGNKVSGDPNTASNTARSVMTIAFEFAFETHMQESVAAMARQYIRTIISSVQRALPVFTFANQAGLDMLETTLVALQEITLEKILDEHGRKSLCSEFPQIMQQGFACLQGGICLSSMGRPVSYERAVAWKVLNEEENAHCICFMFIN
ncbi:Homeodomain-containing protein, partial [Cynara cardunculus var. scolymus]